VRRTDHLVAISHHTAGDVRQHLGWTGELPVIHNGARNLADAPQEALPGWSAAPSTPFLFHLSRMSPSKNPQALLGLAAAWPQMTFVFSGPPSDEAKHLRATVRLPNVQFHLGISDAQKAWAYAHCTGFLFPSLAEGFGLPPIEAMHFGKPVFLARRTCLPEIGGDAADYFDDFAPAAMRRIVERGLQRHVEVGRAQAIRDHAAHFSWDRAADAYLALYTKLLQLPPR
jgi:glycosyltransferase involved in cell wall biosynthesis